MLLLYSIRPFARVCQLPNPNLEHAVLLDIKNSVLQTKKLVTSRCRGMEHTRMDMVGSSLCTTMEVLSFWAHPSGCHITMVGRSAFWRGPGWPLCFLDCLLCVFVLLPSCCFCLFAPFPSLEAHPSGCHINMVGRSAFWRGPGCAPPL